jgi:hypothetical protein
LSTHLRLGLPSGLFPSGFPINTYIHSCSPHSCYMPCPSHPSWLDPSNYVWRGSTSSLEDNRPIQIDVTLNKKSMNRWAMFSFTGGGVQLRVLWTRWLSVGYDRSFLEYPLPSHLIGLLGFQRDRSSLAILNVTQNGV